MKKLAVFAVIGLLLSTTAFANIVVFQDGKATTYKPGSTIAVNAKTTTRVLYDGVLITIPKGQKVQISREREENGKEKVKLFGVNMKGVEVAGKQISSKGQATVSISPETGEVAETNGNATIVKNDVILTDNKSNTQKVNKPVVPQTKTQTAPKAQTQQAAPAKTQTVEPVVFPTVSEYVNEVTAQQSTQDVECMSPSSPTGC